MNKQRTVIEWLLEGDAAIQYQVHRDLLKSADSLQNKLQERIAREGWGALYLVKRAENGHWGRGFYQPKWTSTHYTLLDLKNLGFPVENAEARESVRMVLEQPEGVDGGINYARTVKYSDVCINGMILNFASYFNFDHPAINPIINYLLAVQMNDGGWNCQYSQGAVHSSLHTTICVLEGLLEYRRAGGSYRRGEIREAEEQGVEFILQHQLYKSHRTGETIDNKMLMLSYPSRWRYDILRALDYFQAAGVGYDNRMNPALEILLKKQSKDGKWPVQMKHPGQVHFDMEKTGQASRWNTLRALRVLNCYERTYT